MKWKKAGLIYSPDGSLWWAKSYALLPTAEQIGKNTVRGYFSSLDENFFGRVGYTDLDANDLHKVLHVSAEPVLDIGELGAFDDSGVNPSSIINIMSKKYLYYIGWQRTVRVPYMLFSGLAVSENSGKTFTKNSKTPVLDRTTDEPFSRSAPFVLAENGVFKMWYWSCIKWSVDENIKDNSSAVHYNNVIRYAESDDGINWKASDRISIELGSEDEYSVGRPCVLYEDGKYKMWYSIRSKSKPYAIGYAESKDGISWVRKDDEAGIERSTEGWDSEMICYPFVINVNGKKIMFYNGNRHGKTGFGYAVLES